MTGLKGLNMRCLLQVEGDEARLAPPEQEIVEQGLPVAVQAHDLAIKDDCPLQFGAGYSHSLRKDLNSFPLRETSFDRPCSMWARALKSSYLISNSQS